LHSIFTTKASECVQHQESLT